MENLGTALRKLVRPGSYCGPPRGQELPVPTFFATNNRMSSAMYPMAKDEALKALRSNIFKALEMLFDKLVISSSTERGQLH